MPSLLTNSTFFRMASTVVTQKYTNTVKEETETYGEVFNEYPPDGKRPFITLQPYTVMGLMSLMPDGQAPSYDQPFELTPFTATYLKYGLGYRYTEDAQDDDVANMLGTLSHMLAYSRIITEEYLYWNTLNLGFNSGVVGPDGVSLFNTAHPVPKVPASTQSNSAGTTALAPESLFAGKLAFKALVDDRGMPIRRTPAMLIVPLELEATAKEILQTDKYPYSDENRINTQKGGLRLVVSRYLTSITAWFLLANKGKLGTDAHPLFVSHKYKDRQQTWVDKETGIFGHKGYFRSIWGWPTWYGTYGSQGA